jgi:carbamoyltransferase
MNVLGINCYLHDSAAALFQEGKLIFAAEEERFSRIKKDARFPRLAIEAALDHAGVRPQDLDAIAFGWNRGGVMHLHTLRSMVTGRLPFKPRLSAHMLLGAIGDMYRGAGSKPLRRLFEVPRSTPVFFIDHHVAHAWSAYAPSGFEDALVLVTDNRGATQATTLHHAREGVLKRVMTIDWPDSLGAFYEAFTYWLGFEPQSDEWKVMGLAAYGEPDRDLSQFIKITPDGYHVNAGLVCANWWNDNSQLEKILGPRRRPEVLITDEDRNVAASVQKATEDALFAIVREGVRITGCRRLCLAGGVALNSKANGRLLASGLVDEIFVQPAAADDGTAIGAGLVAHERLGKPVPRQRLAHAYLGPEFNNDELAAAVRTYKLHAFEVLNLEERVASLLAGGAIVGWFQGRMEFGPRALGSRSILADPTRADMKDRVNDSVKFRESWRPFAPSCLAESAADYFEGAGDSAFMTITYEVRAGQRDRIPAVTHADNTARIQTVNRDSNPRYWRLIKEFEKQTGVPVILNTSFNLRGEPIVCTPKDAIRTFYSSGLDFLVLGDLVIAKDPTWTPNASSSNGAARHPLVALRHEEP